MNEQGVARRAHRGTVRGLLPDLRNPQSVDTAFVIVLIEASLPLLKSVPAAREPSNSP